MTTKENDMNERMKDSMDSDISDRIARFLDSDSPNFHRARKRGGQVGSQLLGWSPERARETEEWRRKDKPPPTE